MPDQVEETDLPKEIQFLRYCRRFADYLRWEKRHPPNWADQMIDTYLQAFPAHENEQREAIIRQVRRIMVA